MSISGTLRDIANESALSKSEKTLLRLIAKKYGTLKSSHGKLVEALGHIDTCLSIMKCTKSEDGLKDLPELATELKTYVEQALSEAE